MESISNDFCRYSRSNEISPAGYTHVKAHTLPCTHAHMRARAHTHTHARMFSMAPSLCVTYVYACVSLYLSVSLSLCLCMAVCTCVCVCVCVCLCMHFCTRVCLCRAQVRKFNIRESNERNRIWRERRTSRVVAGKGELYFSLSSQSL